MDETASRRVIGAAIEVHQQLGPGLLESIYHACMTQELVCQGPCGVPGGAEKSALEAWDKSVVPCGAGTEANDDGKVVALRSAG
jgi:PD-(D/E)XK nuclease superfamily